jgi:hypothetical protein
LDALHFEEQLSRE